MLDVVALSPLVASARINRMAATGNYQALGAMGAEKATAFTAASVGMMFSGAAAMTRIGWALANAYSPWGGTARQRLARIETAARQAPVDVLESALRPIGRKVRSNSKRLGR